ncbi:protein LURP-one-related 8-like [Triticum urartu]|uniref:Protein LURP-one-related 8 n=1 Tax=Triticum urartu TaxID=4572 RepID=A0A8R7UNE9_TRIUA|nr:protein LURP-one-related 8-like [Triticum urartu]
MNKIKVHPNVAAASLALPAAEKGEAVSLTVWRRSLLFNGKGFTVFDTNGNLVFRVETHSRGSPREVVLMDAHGVAILTVRRKKLSLAEEWLVYDGDGDEPAPRRFTARRNRNLLRTKSLARLSPPRSLDGTGDAPGCRYDVEGSYAGRSLDMFACTSCASGGNQRQRVATVSRKEAAVGPDVFRLMVEPDLEPALAMAVVILLDQMNAS